MRWRKLKIIASARTVEIRELEDPPGKERAADRKGYRQQVPVEVRRILRRFAAANEPEAKATTSTMDVGDG